MLLTTDSQIAGYEIVQTLGMVRGSTVRARNFLRDFVAGLRSLVGGEITEYTRLQAMAREQAIARMLAEAQKVQAQAVVTVRLETSMIMNGACEILVYGTAVQVKAKK